MATVLVSQHVMKLYEKYKKRNFLSRPSNNEALISSTSLALRIFVEREKRRYIYYILSHFVKLSRCDNPAPCVAWQIYTSLPSYPKQVFILTSEAKKKELYPRWARPRD